MKTITLLISILISLFYLTANAQTNAEAEQAVKDAQSLQEQTIAVGHEWSTIKPLIAKAKQALKANEYKSAITFAKKASEQSKLALIQAQYEKANWKSSLPK